MSHCPLEAGMGKLLCKEIAEDKSKGGIILPANRDRNLRTYEILSVGPGRMGKLGIREEVPYSVGDRVYIDASMQHQMSHDGVFYTVVEQEFVWAVVKK